MDYYLTQNYSYLSKKKKLIQMITYIDILMTYDNYSLPLRIITLRYAQNYDLYSLISNLTAV